MPSCIYLIYYANSVAGSNCPLWEHIELCRILICNSHTFKTLSTHWVSFTQAHYRQAAYAVGAGLTLYLVLLFPLFLIRASVWTSSFFIDLNKSKWDSDLIDMGLIVTYGGSDLK